VGTPTINEEPNRLIDPAPLSRLLAGFTDVLDIRDPKVSVLTPSCFLLFLFLVLFAHLRARYGDLVSDMLGEIDAFAAEAIALSVLTSDRVLASFITLLQAASDRYTASAFRFRLIFLCCPGK
jgi:hypothetical protein